MKIHYPRRLGRTDRGQSSDLKCGFYSNPQTITTSIKEVTCERRKQRLKATLNARESGVDNADA